MTEQSDQTPTTSVAAIGGVAIDLAQTPDYGGAEGSYFRSTGRGYTAPDDENEDETVTVAYVEIVNGARPDGDA